MAYKGGEFTTVQVKTASPSPAGPYRYIQCRTRLTNKYQQYSPKDVADTYAIIFRDNIWIIPSEKIESSNISLGVLRPEPDWSDAWLPYMDTLH